MAEIWKYLDSVEPPVKHFFLASYHKSPSCGVGMSRRFAMEWKDDEEKLKTCKPCGRCTKFKRKTDDDQIQGKELL
jgi:hypothetical protein